MSKEEAIKIFNEVLLFGKARCTQAEFKELAEMSIKALEQEPTTNNDLAQERYQDLIDYFGDKESAKTILEDRKEFKAWLERLRWHVKRADELARELEQLKSTTNNDLGVECVSRQAVEALVWEYLKKGTDENIAFYEHFLDLPTVTPIRPKGHWIVEKGGSYLGKRNACCSNCKDFYSNDWNVFNYCPNCGADMREGVEE